MPELKQAQLVRPTDKETALQWKCSCGNADIRVFLGPLDRKAGVQLSLNAVCESCGDSVGEITNRKGGEDVERD